MVTSFIIPRLVAIGIDFTLRVLWNVRCKGLVEIVITGAWVMKMIRWNKEKDLLGQTISGRAGIVKPYSMTELTFSPLGRIFLSQ